MSLQDDAAAGCRVVVGTDFLLFAVHIVDVGVAFPLVVDLSDGDQLDRLPLKGRDGGSYVKGNISPLTVSRVYVTLA